MGDPVAEVKYLEGKIVSMRAHTHRHQEWLKFVKQIERETPADVGLHLMADNYARSRHGDIHKWLAKDTRFQMYFHPHVVSDKPRGRRSSAKFTGLNRC